MAPRILITRAPHQASPLAEALRARGLEPILIPTIELAPPSTFAPLDAAIANLAGQGSQPPFHWLLFTSANAVEAFASRLAVLKGTGFSPSVQSTTDRVPQGFSAAADRVLQGFSAAADRVPQGFSLGSHSAKEGNGALAPGECLIAAIGPATARAITQLLGTNPTLTSEKAIAESLAEALLPHARQPDGSPTRFLLIRAETARDVLPETLQAAGGEVTIAPAYRTVIPQNSIPPIRALFHSPETYPDAITFTSSSTVINLLALLEAAELSLPPHIPRISIGPITSQTLRDLKLPPHAESAEPNIPSLVDKIFECVA